MRRCDNTDVCVGTRRVSCCAVRARTLSEFPHVSVLRWCVYASQCVWSLTFFRVGDAECDTSESLRLQATPRPKGDVSHSVHRTLLHPHWCFAGMGPKPCSRHPAVGDEREQTVQTKKPDGVRSGPPLPNGSPLDCGQPRFCPSKKSTLWTDFSP